MKNSISKQKLKKVENELKENWKEYREMPLEEIRTKLINKLRQETQNKNDQLSHKEFYEIIKKIMSSNQDNSKKSNNIRKIEKSSDKNSGEER